MRDLTGLEYHGEFEEAGVREHPGYEGVFTDRDDERATIRRGERVMKRDSLPTDSHPDGSLATVLGSIYHPTKGVAYFVEWDDRPGFAVVILESRVQRPS